MYIKELILKNFAGVYAAMKTDYVRLDLSKRKNKIFQTKQTSNYKHRWKTNSARTLFN